MHIILMMNLQIQYDHNYVNIDKLLFPSFHISQNGLTSIAI